MTEIGELDSRLADFAVSLIRPQIPAAPQDAARSRDEFARGYVLGVCDAICQRAGIADEDRCVAMALIVLLDLYGEAQGEAMGRSLLSEMGAGASMRGQILGGSDLMEFVSMAAPSGPPPAGLSAHIAKDASARASGES